MGTNIHDTSIKNDEKILIGSNIRRLRQQRKLKPRELVLQVQLRGVDINVFSLSKIEANNQHVRASQFKAIAQVLDVDCMELLKGQMKNRSLGRFLCKWTGYNDSQSYFAYGWDYYALFFKIPISTSQRSYSTKISSAP